ncbi:ATP-binding cassette domain-containing protein [Rhodobacteraceae bacterium F11138]|nr:ATP-binding cassette domain-containing protein [Rhodobacteraceae bacterium F11138]
MAVGLDMQDGQVGLRDGDRVFRLQVKALQLEPGQIVALTGASGSGKTLLLELLGLLRRPGSGTRYRSGGLDLAGLWSGGPRSASLARTRGRLFGFVPQTGGLMPFLNVAENVALTQRVTDRTDRPHMDALLGRLGLRDVVGLRPGALSIGQRQRAAIARALAHRSPFVIADEPTAALDNDSADRVLDLFLDTARQQGTGVILSSHDTARIARFGIPCLHLATRTEGAQVIARLEDGPC